MKVKIIIIFNIILHLLNIPITSCQDTNDTFVAIESVWMNVLYVDIDNPLRIIALDMDSIEYEVTTSNGMIFDSNGLYFVRPKKIGTSKIAIYIEGTKIREKCYQVKPLPNISTVFQIDSSDCSYIMQKDISKATLLNAFGLKIVAGDIDFDIGFTIEKFTLSISIDDSTYHSVVSNRCAFSVKQKELIYKSNIESDVIIEDIVVKRPDGSVSKMPPLIFRITDE